MDLGLSMYQKQTLSITPELKQSIHILQLSSYELIKYLQQQAESNPLIEIDMSPSKYREEMQILSSNLRKNC